MRTLKKSLCLVMALVFVLGLCTVGVGAAFTDDAKVTYTNAVSVMAGLGIIQGDDNDGDGKMEFRPKDTITRAEACVIIARTILGDGYAKLPKAGVSFSDVGPGMSEWAMPAIAFCEARGIVNGRGDGKFYPTDNVTGIEMAKMLLCANGYGSDGRYVGKGWSINTFTDATTYKIYKSVADAVDFEDPATREECALYTLNTLQNVKQLEVGSDGKLVEGKTLGEQVWDMVTIVGQILENEATGANFTVIKYDELQDDGKTYKTVEKNFKFDYGDTNPLSLIAHEVTVFVNDEEIPSDKGAYKEIYNLEDNSTTFSAFFQSYDAIYKNVVAASKLNAALNPGEVDYWLNYSYRSAADTGYTNIFAGATTPDAFSDMSGKENSLLFYAATFVYDGAGDLKAIMNSDFTVGKVTKIDKDGTITVFTPDVANNFSTATKPYDPALTTAYDGIAEKDYVSVQQVGKLYTIQPLTTKNVKVSSLDSSYTVNPVNAFTNDARKSGLNYTPGLVDNSSYTITAGTLDLGFAVIPWNTAAPKLTLGNTYTFYIAPDGSYVDVAAVSDTDTGDYLFLIDFVADTVMGTLANNFVNTTTYYARVADAAGEMKTYKLDKDYATTLLGKDSTKTGDSGKVTIDGKKSQTVYNFKLDADGEINYLDETKESFTKDLNRTSYITSGGTKYYVTSSTKIFYLKALKTDGVNKEWKISSAASLPTAALTSSQLFGYAVDATSGKELKVIWINDIPSVETEEAESSYIFMASKGEAGTELVGEKVYSYYSGYVDGVENTKIYVANPEKVTEEDTFYTYSVTDGVYTLTPFVSNSSGSVKVQTATEATFDYNTTTGKYYTNADGVDISDIKVVNTTHAADGKGTYLKLGTLDEIAAHIATAGNTVTVKYLVKVDDKGNETPFGAMYVTAATAP